MTTETNFIDKAANLVNNLIGSESTRTGGFDGLSKEGGGLLTFPSDLATGNAAANGMVHWVQFTPYFKKNGKIIGTVIDTAANVIGAVGEGIAETTAETTDAIGLAETALNLAAKEVAEALDTSGNNKGKTSRLNRGNETTGDQVSIYLPEGIMYTDQMNYEEVGFASIKNMANASALKGGFGIGLLKQLGGAVDKAASILGQESVGIEDYISSQLGVVINPRKEQMFRGVSFRSFDFKFNLIPKSKQEAQDVINIIKTFRFHAYPELSQNSAFFQFPSEFDIQFKTLDFSNGGEGKPINNPNLPKLKRCYLEKIDTNYTPDTIYRSFSDGKPIRVELSLSFKEASYITRNDVTRGF